MTRLNKNDLAQMNRDYFQSLDKKRLVEVATNLHQLAVEQWEKLQQNSKNSSRPPSSDNPYNRAIPEEKDEPPESSPDQEGKPEQQEVSTSFEQSNNSEATAGQPHQVSEENKKSPGHQPGTPGKWRSTPLVASLTIPHRPSHCAACNQLLTETDSKPYMGHYVLEERKGGIRILGRLSITPLLWGHLPLRTCL